jgi:hypothetical protein
VKSNWSRILITGLAIRSRFWWAFSSRYWASSSTKGMSLYNSINLNHLWRDSVVPLAVEDISLEVKGSHYII